MITREEWLLKAVDLLRPYFKEHGYEIPEFVKVSCGFPSVKVKTAEGQCFNASAAVDGIRQIYISPYISDSLKVLDILTHELIHSCLDDDVAHKKPFRKACNDLGLEGPVTQAHAGEELLKELESLLTTDEGSEDLLPKYPHAKLVPSQIEKVQTTRMHKLICKKNAEHPETDIILRASKKVTALGLPTCFCRNDFEIVQEEENET